MTADQVSFHPASFCDDGGRLFTHDGGLYRALLPPGLEIWQALSNSGLGDELMDEGLLIRTQPAGFKLEGYELVLEHRRLPYVSYPAEWCPSMLRDAAQLALQLQYRLIAHGLIAIDTNPWNILFDRGRPVYVDLCSIVLAGDEQYSSKQRFEQFAHYFHNYFHNPLTAMSYGYGDVVRAMSRHYDERITEEIRRVLDLGRPLSRMISQGISGTLRKLRWRRPSQRLDANEWDQGLAMLADRGCMDRMHRWLRHVETLRLPEAEAALDPADGRTPARVFEDYDPDMLEGAGRLLADKRPSSVVSLGGVMPSWAEAEGIPAVLTHPSVQHVERMYTQIGLRSLNWLPVLMSLRHPTPAHGGCGTEFPAASQRFRSDIGLALGTTFDLFDRHSLTLEQLTQTFASFCERGLIIDFISRARRGHASSSRSKDWGPYQLDEFRGCLGRCFDTIETVYTADDGSALLWCEHGPHQPAIKGGGDD